jgi:hypothetical protein
MSRSNVCKRRNENEISLRPVDLEYDLVHLDAVSREPVRS